MTDQPTDNALPYDTCPRCGSDDLLIIAERIHSLDGSLADDASEQIGVGTLVCAARCGSFRSFQPGFGIGLWTHAARIEATLDRAARRAEA